MSFSECVKENKEKLLDYFHAEGGNITRATKKFCDKFNVFYDDSIRRWASKILNEHKEIEFAKEDVIIPEEALKRELNKSRCYIITWEQNESKLHENLWNNILAYKEFLNAELSVILGRYKNPTSVHVDVEHDNWNPKTKAYWDANRHHIHKHCTILGDIKIQPTAVTPLTGLESITGETSTIIGHPKQHLKSIPVLENQPKKILLSTGAITMPNYTDSKAGKRGEFNHTLGFVIVEIKNDDVFFIRQVEADKDGNFIDLYYKVENGQVFENEDTSCIVFGDTHVGNMDERLMPSTTKLIDRLNIKEEIHHDIIDGDSVNGHIVNDPIQKYRRMMLGKDSVLDDLNEVISFLGERNTKKIIVQSNHNDRFDRWLVNQDWKLDLKNAIMYLNLVTAKLENKANKGVVPYWIEKHFDEDRVLCLDYDDSYKKNGFELAYHGHIGSNGVRGTLEQFRRLSTRMIIGHYHSPQKMDGVIAVGTCSKLRAGYNKGASSWLHAHALVYKNNTAQLIIFVDGEYTTFV